MKMEELAEGLVVKYTSKGGETTQIGVVERISCKGMVFVKYFNEHGQLEYIPKATSVEDLERYEEK